MIDLIKDCSNLTFLQPVLKKYYNPTRELPIDELTIGIRCRIELIKYMPKKLKKAFACQSLVTAYNLIFIKEEKMAMQRRG